MITDPKQWEAFRAEAMEYAADMLTERVDLASFRIGLPAWEEGVVESALQMFDLTLKGYGAKADPDINAFRDSFETESRRALSSLSGKTARSAIHGWVSRAGFNAATEAAARVNGFGLERVGSCQYAHDAESYPGRPGTLGWIQCGCAIRPVEAAVTAAGTGNASDPGVAEGEEPKAAVVVLRPRQEDPVVSIASGVHPHTTLLYLGDGQVDLAELLAIVERVAAEVGHLVTDKVNGRAVLGADKADVLLLDASGSSLVREILLHEQVVEDLLGMQEQFPAWIPHITVGYPDAPAEEADIPEDVTYDLISVWRGNEQWDFRLEPEAQEPEGIVASSVNVVHPEDDAFTQEMADGLIAAIPTEDEQIDAEMAERDAARRDTEALEAEYAPVPWHGILVVEGADTGDRRRFKQGAISNRPLPLPLKWMPADAAGHDDSRVVGRIDKLWRDGNLIKAEGVFDNSEDAYTAISQLANKMLRGTSIDVDAVIETEATDVQEFEEARICASTICAIPAFAEGFVALGPWDDAPEDEEPTEHAEFDIAPPKTKDGPGWITDPKPTQHITGYWVDGRGAAKIGWGAPGDFDRCRVQLGKYVQNPDWLAGLCANLHYRALGTWPGQQHAGGTDLFQQIPEASEAIVASVAFAEDEPVSADFFRNPGLEGPTPLTVTPEGRVFGHVATWGTCHIGFPDDCKTAPHSVTGYANFTTGAVNTDAGLVPVGQISLGGGHASVRPGVGVRAALAHYDQTSTAVADIAVGEDEHGIWFSGMVRDGVTPRQVKDLRAAALSGDWRRVVVNGRANLEMVAALAVNVPGFPIPRAGLVAGGQADSLVAAAPVLPSADMIHAVNDARAFFRAMEVDKIRAEFNLIGG